MIDSLGDRMKGYENIPRISLIRRTPVIIRLDGKAFHTLTRGMVKPYAPASECMWDTAKAYVRKSRDVSWLMCKVMKLVCF